MPRCKTITKIDDQTYECQMDAGENDYCILHDPDPNKDKEKFVSILRTKIKDPTPQHIILRGVVFTTLGGLFEKRIEKALFFEGSIFKCDVDFSGTTFGTTVSFKQAVFENKCCFDKSVFKAQSFWAGAKFKGDCSFRGAVFERSGDFDNNDFIGQCDFKNGRFAGDNCHITNSNFYEITSFEGVLFNGQLHIDNSHFHESVSFRDAKLSSFVAMRKTEWKKDVDLSAISINGEFHINDSVFIKNIVCISPQFSAALRFHKVNFGGDARFDKVTPNIKMTFDVCKLDGLYLRFLPFIENNVELQNCSWPRTKFLFWKGRRIIHDEKEKFKDATLVKLYRKLHKYYYDKSEFDLASDFYVGFQIANRKAKKFKNIHRLISIFYSVGSKYGESICRPLFALIALWLIVPLVLLMLGIRLDPGDIEPVKLKGAIGGDFILFMADYWRAFAYNLSLSTLFRSSDLRPPITSWQHMILLIETILNGLFISFIALGIRRQFVPKKPE